MDYTIRIYDDGNEYITKAKEGENLLDVLIHLDINIDAPCGGNGTCGKCKVKIEGDIAPPSEKELDLLGNAFENGYRLACHHNIHADIDVFIDNTSDDAEVMTKGQEIDIEAIPVVKKQVVKLDDSTLKDQRSILTKLTDGKELDSSFLDLMDLNQVNDEIDKENSIFTLVDFKKQLIAIEANDTMKMNYALAVDIGTTTVACYLVDALNGKVIDVESFLNPQKRFGADVISRIDFLMKNKNIESIRKPLINRINKAIDELISNNDIKRSNIYSAYFVGNTTMIHFFLGLNPEKIAKAPFIPLTTKAHTSPSSKIGIDIASNGMVITLPMVASYIGADTVSAVLSSKMTESEEISLLLDLGTNGEIVLGNSKFLKSCSAAAGPAFEGANIRNGVAGIKGAIDDIKLIDHTLKVHTIQGEKPIGICGSAIVDIIASLLNKDIVDETGRFYEEDELDVCECYSERMVEIDDMDAFLIIHKDHSGIDDDIALTQKDIREVQNAKAAIAAGVRILIDQSGIKMSDVKHVYLAGGFGSYIDIENAASIGLIPKELKDKVISIGNGAGTGACMCAINEKYLEKAVTISKDIEYIELSSNPAFTNAYVEEMIFE